MKIALAQLNYHIGNFEGNLQKILEHIQLAKNAKVDIVCFGELAVCGYPPRDFLEFSDFIKSCEQSIEAIRVVSKGIAIVVGAPCRNPVLEGKDLYNSAYFIADQEIQAIQHKALLPTYDVFDEYRYFEPGNKFQLVSYEEKKIALTICEDIWNVGNENPLYVTCPLDEVKDQHPDFVINISASPFSYTQAQQRLDVIKANVNRYNIPLFYVNHVGAQTELIFDGGSIVTNADGIVVEEMPYFQESFKIFNLEDVVNCKSSTLQKKDKSELIYKALIKGVSDYFNKLGFKKAVIGLSGGIDSALTTVLATEALGKENVRVLLMPSQYSSDHSIRDAINLAEKLGIIYDIIPIEEIFSQYTQSLESIFAKQQTGVAEENIQARIRGMLLMALSNKFGNILLNTSNKSEMAVGYGTLYGDMCGGLSVIGDIYKTEVYELSNYINRNEEIIPTNTINKAPSAELRPDQKDSDSLPEYDILDTILREYIENRKGPSEIIQMGYEEALVKRILRLVNINEFKRHQTAPVLRVSSKAFGMGRRVPIVGKYLN